MEGLGARRAATIGKGTFGVHGTSTDRTGARLRTIYKCALCLHGGRDSDSTSIQVLYLGSYVLLSC